MSIPYFCKHCGDLIGVEPELRTLRRLHSGRLVFDSSIDCVCPGKGKHAEPTRVEHQRLFNLIKDVILSYPETRTISSWSEYTGPAKRFWLWFAIVFGTPRYPNGSYRGLVVNGKWAYWDWRLGLYGDGADELFGSPKPKPAT